MIHNISLKKSRHSKTNKRKAAHFKLKQDGEHYNENYETQFRTVHKLTKLTASSDWWRR